MAEIEKNKQQREYLAQMKSDWWPNEALDREEMAIIDAEEEIVKTESRQVSEEDHHTKKASVANVRLSSYSKETDTRGSPDLLSNKYEADKRLGDAAHIQQILEKIKKQDQIENQGNQNLEIWEGTAYDKKISLYSPAASKVNTLRLKGSRTQSRDRSATRSVKRAQKTNSEFLEKYDVVVLNNNPLVEKEYYAMRQKVDQLLQGLTTMLSMNDVEDVL